MHRRWPAVKILYPDIDLLLVQDAGEQPIQRDQAEGIIEGGVLSFSQGQGHADLFVEPAQRVGMALRGGKMDEPEDTGHHTAEHEDKQRIFSEYVEKPAPGPPRVPELDEIDEEREDAEGPARGDKGIAAAPDLFVDREQLTPAIARQEQDHRRYEEMGEHFEGFSFQPDIGACKITKDDTRDGRKGCRQSLGIKGHAFAMIEMRLSEDGFIEGSAEPAGDTIGIGRVAQGQAQRPIEEQQDAADKNGAAQFGKIDDKGGEAITKSRPLQHAHDPNPARTAVVVRPFPAHARQVPVVIVEEGEPVEEKGDDTDQQRTAKDFFPEEGGALLQETRQHERQRTPNRAEQREED